MYRNGNSIHENGIHRDFTVSGNSNGQLVQESECRHQHTETIETEAWRAPRDSHQHVGMSDGNLYSPDPAEHSMTPMP